MRKGVAKPEYNSGVKITIPVRTRTPLEAFKMLEAGQPVDVMAGYYDKMGILEQDFQLMDHIDKLKALNRYKDLAEKHKTDYEELTRQAKERQQIEIDNEKQGTRND